MKVRALRRLHILWIVTLSVLFGAMAPAISASFGFQGGTGLGAICSVRTDQYVAQAPGSDGREEAPGIAHLFEHCPYCSSHADHVGMPSVALVAAALPLSHAVHDHFLAAAPTFRIWSDARSRAPPQAV